MEETTLKTQKNPWNITKDTCLTILTFASRMKPPMGLTSKEIASIGELNLESVQASLPKWQRWSYLIGIPRKGVVGTPVLEYFITNTGVHTLNAHAIGWIKANSLGETKSYKVEVAELFNEIVPKFKKFVEEKAAADDAAFQKRLNEWLEKQHSEEVRRGQRS